MSELTAKITAAGEYISKFWQHKPVAGIILGSGLGNLTAEIEDSIEIPYSIQ